MWLLSSLIIKSTKWNPPISDKMTQIDVLVSVFLSTIAAFCYLFSVKQFQTSPDKKVNNDCPCTLSNRTDV